MILTFPPKTDQFSNFVLTDRNTAEFGEVMKTNKFDHICIAVRNLDAARKLWEPVLGKAKPDDIYVCETEEIDVARYLIGDVGFELMESTTPDGPVKLLKM